VASANAASDVMAVVTTVAVAVVTKANTKAKRMKILRMIVPRFPRIFYAREPITICDPHHEMATLAERDHDALLLLAYLRVNNGPWADFWIADGLAKTFGWGPNRLSAARRRLIERGDVTLVAPQRRRTPALYCWGTKIKTLWNRG
jgi:hypothetical protein